MKTAGSSGSSDNKHLIGREAQPNSYVLQSIPHGQLPEETGRRPDPLTSESLVLLSVGSLDISPCSQESVARRSSLVEPLREIPGYEVLIIDITLEDISIDRYPYYDLSQLAFPPVPPGTLVLLTVDPSLDANCLTWSSNGQVDSRFYYLEQSLNRGSVCLLSPVGSFILLLLLPQIIDNNMLVQDVCFLYSALFFEDATWHLVH
jgi:hypothetical protein